MRGISCLMTMAFSLLLGIAGATSVAATRALDGGEQAVTSPLRVPLRVHNLSELSRQGEPVTTGVPLAKESGMLSTDQLQLTDSQGNPVAAQFRVLSRWGRLEDVRAPIRWVLIDFQADLAPHGVAFYWLQQGPQTSVPSHITVSVSDSAVEVSTGPLAVRIPKQGAGLLEQLWFLGTDGHGDTERSGRRALLFKPVTLRVERSGGPYHAMIAKTGGVRIEEAGPLRTVVHVRGTFQASDGRVWVGGDARPTEKDGRPRPEERPLEFEARLTFYAGKSYLKLTLALENNGNSLATYYPVNDTFFDGLYLDVPWRMEALRRVAFPDHNEVTEPGGQWLLTQTHTVRDKVAEAVNFSRQLTHNGRSVKTGRRDHGWAMTCTETLCRGVGVRAFWQNYPKSIEVHQTGAAIGLWSAGVSTIEEGPYGRGSYFYSGGWHKTHEVLVGFWAQGAQNWLEEGGLLEPPLLALAPPNWYADTRAWSLIAPAGFRTADRTVQEAVARYERFRAVLIDPHAADDGVTVEHLRETRGLASPRAPGFHFDLDLYGWEAFGELPWGGNRAGLYSALHYDWPYILWLHLMRSGDPRYWPIALEMTDHSADMDQIHHASPNMPNLNGLWWWEQLRDSKGHHRSTKSAGTIVSHTWNGGYALGYLLTGNPRYHEAAEAGAMAGQRFWFEFKKVHQAPVVYDQTRSQGWSILMLINLYRIDGHVEHLRNALTIFTNSLLYTEQLSTPPGSGGKGYITIGQYPDQSYTGKVVVTFLTYPLEPLAELHYEASLAGLDVQALEAYLIRSLDWLKNYAYVGGVADPGGRYSALTLSYTTDPSDRSQNQGGTVQHNIHVAGGFGYGFWMLQDKDRQRAKEYLDFGRRLFRDLMSYRNTADLKRDVFFDPDKRGPIQLGSGAFTKELGWIGRSGQFYLYAEYLLGKEENRQQ